MATKISYVRNAVLLIAVLSCCLLIGCDRDKSLVAGETKSGKWFLDHPDERREALAICEENNGELRNLPNCKNAINAETAARMQHKRVNK